MADWFADDPALARFLALYEAPAVLKEAEAALGALGRLGPSVLDRLSREADRQRPREVARGAGPGGQDGVAYPPAYRELQRLAREHRVFTASWHPFAGQARAPRTVHFALGYLYAQSEAGYYCPGCMTDGAAWVLDRRAPREMRDHAFDRLVSLPAEGAWEGAMLLTEKGGGSDVGAATQTRAERHGQAWRLTGQKYFASNCTAEVILTLARMPGGAPGTKGLGLFLVPRILPGGQPNQGIVLTELKDKLGVTSMATAELEFHGAQAFLLAGEGEGFAAMAEMVNLSRLYNAVASVAVARRALRLGLEHGRTRVAFGKPLAEQPLYRLRLTMLALEVEGALAVVLEAAHQLDQPGGAAVLRAITPLAKACTGRLAVRAASEGCEFLGGDGYVEDASVAPRLLRDAQVLPIWEGTTNIQALDFLRAARRDRATEALQEHARALLAQAGRSADGLAPTLAALHQAWAGLAREVAATPPDLLEVAAARLVEQHYHALAGTLLARAAASLPPGPERDRAVRVAEAFVAWRVAPAGIEGQRAVERAAQQHGLAVAYGAGVGMPR